MKAKLLVASVTAVLVGLVVGAAAFAGPLSESETSVLPSSSCGPVFYKGAGSPQYLIATDLPLQGAGRAQLLAMQQAVQFVLERQYKFKAGRFTVGYQGCDDSTAQTGAWDPAKCSSNARAYAAERTLLGVLGTFNSGCAKLDPPDPEPGSGRSGCDAQLGEHERGPHAQRAVEQPRRAEDLLPDRREELRAGRGERRLPGTRAVALLQSKAFKLAQGREFKAVRNVFVLHDNQTFGKGVAQAIQARAKARGLRVLGFVTMGCQGDELRGDR